MRGNKEKIYEMTYQLTFVKDALEKDNCCPKCGAPIENNKDNKCSYCRATIINNSEDWVMSNKKLIKQR